MSTQSPTMQKARADAREVFLKHPTLVRATQGADGNAAICDLITLGWLAGAMHANREAADLAKGVAS